MTEPKHPPRWQDEHILRIETVDGDREVKVWHPESCTQIPLYDGNVRGYDCAIGHHLNEWGLDLHLADVPDGTYLATYWATPARWAGATQLDAEDGIDLQALMVDPSWDEIP